MRQPEEKDAEKTFLWKFTNFLGFGVFSGFWNGWYMDDKKIPKIKFMQSLRFHLKHFKYPLTYWTVLGLGFAGTDYILEKYRGGEGKRSLQENALIGFNTLFFPTLLKRSLPTSIRAGVTGAAIYTLYRHHVYSNEPAMKYREKEILDSMRVPIYENPPVIPDFHKRRIIFGFPHFEDATDDYSPEKLNDKRPNYREE